MAYNNNIYGNAAYVGSLGGMLGGRLINSAVAASYAPLRAAAVAFASSVDALIAFDALVSTAASNTQLAQTTNAISANEQWRAALLQGICNSVWSGRYPTAAEAAANSVLATAVYTLWNAALADLATP